MVASVAVSVAGAVSFMPGRAHSSGAPVVINEVMFHPASGGTEWIELWNMSSEGVSLRGWTVEDSRRKPSLITPIDLLLGPDTHLILAASREALLNEFAGIDPASAHELAGSWPPLNNSQPSGQPYADLVILTDEIGTAVDSVAYGADWGIPGYSLERLSPRVGSIASNWCPSLAPERATPGADNSVYLEGQPVTGLRAEPNPFRPEIHGVTFVSFGIPAGSPTLRLQVFDIHGALVRTLVDDRLAGATGRLAWDGRNDLGDSVPTGIYVLYLQAVDTDRRVTREAKGTVVVARGY
jgi:hypothetical protein